MVKSLNVTPQVELKVLVKMNVTTKWTLAKRIYELSAKPEPRFPMIGKGYLTDRQLLSCG